MPVVSEFVFEANRQRREAGFSVPEETREQINDRFEAANKEKAPLIAIRNAAREKALREDAEEDD